MAAAELRDDIDSGPSTHLDNCEEVTSNVSEFAQVIFNNVQECYLPGNDLQCNYTLTPAIKPLSRDWIGVFKVGWTSTRQYRAFEWAVSPASGTESGGWNQDITFKAYYLPKDEDGEYYQLCYIDAGGKMRGASTPFQFLEQSADDFIQVLDDSMDILMIHNKTEYCVEELKRVQEEKQELEEECLSLRGKVVTLETELKTAQEELEAITTQYRAYADSNSGMETELKSLSTQLTEAKDKIVNLSEEAGNYESSLQQTEGAFMEVVNRELALRNKLDEMEKRFLVAFTDKNNLKEKLEAAEKNNIEMCEEIDSLKQLLSHSNETHQEVRESEVRMKEQYQRVQQELQLTSVEKDQFQMMESKFASTEASRSLLSKELDSLKMVQDKLSKDLVAAKTEKESLKLALARQTKEMKEEKKKMQLHSHQNREKQSLLQEQISALKDGIQQLAQEKEMATKGTKGSHEAQLIATKDLKDKVRRAQFQCKEEVRRRSELQKKMLAAENSFREEKSELKREVEDLRIRLQMAAEEYKKVYTECHQLEIKLEKRKCGSPSPSSSVLSSSSKDLIKDFQSLIRPTGMQMSSQGSQVGYEQATQGVQAITPQATLGIQASNQASQAIQATAASQASSLACQGSQATANQSTQGSQVALAGSNEEKATQSGLPAVAVKMEGALMRPPSRDDTFDLKEMHDQMCSMARELDDRKKDTDNYKRLYQEEREKSAHLDRVWQLKHQSLESKSNEMHEKYNKMLNDYTNMKHSYESLKFDIESQRSASNETPTRALDLVPKCAPVPQTAPVPNSIPGRHMQFVNPYAQNAVQPAEALNSSSSGLDSRYGNPYAVPASDQLPSALMEMSVDSMNLDSIRYPPDTLEDAALSDASDSIPPALLPEPLQPDVLPAAKIAAIKMVSSQMDVKTNEGGMLQPEHTDDEREDAQFVDAQEFPEDAGASNSSYSSGSMPTAPPMSNELTPPTTPTSQPPAMPIVLDPKKCPECVIEFPPTYPEEDFVRHVQRHFAKLCPVCQGLLDPAISQIDFQKHVEECLIRNE